MTTKEFFKDLIVLLLAALLGYLISGYFDPEARPFPPVIQFKISPR